MKSDEIFDAIIIGGGATGTGIARDLSLRGLKVLLLEKNDLCEGTSGRNHAMLHSGARYIIHDKESALQCAKEKSVLLEIAPHIIETCGGYFIAISNKDLEYSDKFFEACKENGIFCEEITPDEFLKLEPKCNPSVKRVFKVKDAYIDPFVLT